MHSAAVEQRCSCARGGGGGGGGVAAAPVLKPEWKALGYVTTKEFSWCTRRYTGTPRAASWRGDTMVTCDPRPRPPLATARAAALRTPCAARDPQEQHIRRHLAVAGRAPAEKGGGGTSW